MIKLTNKNDVDVAFDIAEDRQNAYATCRCLSGVYEQDNFQEWAERCTIIGAPANIIYMFSADECTSDEAADYPWDSDHVTRIEIAEQDPDGDWELL